MYLRGALKRSVHSYSGLLHVSRRLRAGFPPSVSIASANAVHFAIRMAALKSMRVVGCGVRGRKG